MALSEISISDLVLHQTNLAISVANYPTLRQYILERKALLSVTNAVNSVLAEHCTTDKDAFQRSATERACESQKNSDARDEIKDEQERINDASLQANFRVELPSLEYKYNQVDMKCFQQQTIVNQLLSQLNAYKINLEQANNALARIQSDRQLLNLRYLNNLPYPQTNVHTHYPQGTIHTDYPTLPYSSSAIIYSIQDQLIWDRLQGEENSVLTEKQRFKQLIDVKNIEYTRENLNLSLFNDERRQIEDRCKTIRQQLEITLPTNERQRQIRSQERLTRAQVRATLDPNLQQLSHYNHVALKREIKNKNESLDNKRNQLMSKAVETSYSVYMTQLEAALLTNGIKLHYTENEALKLILILMKDYFEMEKTEKVISGTLHREQTKLREFQTKLADSMQQLARYTASNPALIKDNEDLNHANIQLNRDSDSAGSFRTNMLVTSLFSGVTGALGAALIVGLLLNPLFFIIPGVLGLLTVIALTTAVIYHFQKSASDEQIEQNQQTIRTNETKITSQGKKAQELNATTIPGLYNQIESTEKTITFTEKQLADQQNCMRQQFAKASNVTSNYSMASSFYGGTNSMFGTNGFTSTNDFPQPSAPPFEDGTLYPNLSNQK